MGAYQSQATSPSIEPAFGLPLPDAVLDLPPADLYVSLNAHPGRPEVLTAWIDPSVIDETDPLSVDPDARHVRSPARPYDADVRRALPGRPARRATTASPRGCRRSSTALQAAGAWDRIFNLHRVWADLRFADLTLDPSDRQPGCYAGDPRGANYGPFAIGGTSTLRAWLSMWSLETSQCQGAPHLARITVPSLVVQSLADRGVFPSDAHAIHDALAADGQGASSSSPASTTSRPAAATTSPTSSPPGSSPKPDLTAADRGAGRRRVRRRSRRRRPPGST